MWLAVEQPPDERADFGRDAGPELFDGGRVGRLGHTTRQQQVEHRAERIEVARRARTRARLAPLGRAEAGRAPEDRVGLADRARSLEVYRAQPPLRSHEEVRGFAVSPHPPGGVHPAEDVGELRAVAERDAEGHPPLAPDEQAVQTLALDKLGGEVEVAVQLERRVDARRVQSLRPQRRDDALFMSHPLRAITAVPPDLAVPSPLLQQAEPRPVGVEVRGLIDAALAPLHEGAEDVERVCLRRLVLRPLRGRARAEERVGDPVGPGGGRGPHVGHEPAFAAVHGERAPPLLVLQLDARERAEAVVDAAAELLVEGHRGRREAARQFVQLSREFDRLGVRPRVDGKTLPT